MVHGRQVEDTNSHCVPTCIGVNAVRVGAYLARILRVYSILCVSVRIRAYPVRISMTLCLVVVREMCVSIHMVYFIHYSQGS